MPCHDACSHLRAVPHWDISRHLALAIHPLKCCGATDHLRFLFPFLSLSLRFEVPLVFFVLVSCFLPEFAALSSDEELFLAADFLAALLCPAWARIQMAGIALPSDGAFGCFWVDLRVQYAMQARLIPALLGRDRQTYPSLHLPKRPESHTWNKATLDVLWHLSRPEGLRDCQGE